MGKGQGARTTGFPSCCVTSFWAPGVFLPQKSTAVMLIVLIVCCCCPPLLSPPPPHHHHHTTLSLPQHTHTQVPGLEEEFGSDAAAYLAQLVGNGKRFTATVVRRERGLGAREKHPRKAADKLHVVLKGEGDDAKVDVAREMLLEGLARLPRLNKVKRREGEGACVSCMQRTYCTSHSNALACTCIHCVHSAVVPAAVVVATLSCLTHHATLSSPLCTLPVSPLPP